MSPVFNHQLGTLSKEQRNSVFFLFATALQKKAERGPELGSVIIPRFNKRDYIVLYDTPKDSNFPLLKDTKRINNGETTTGTTNETA